MIQKKTQELLEEAIEILREQNPMTVRQLYYQLVSRQVIKNNQSRYNAVSRLMAYARKNGIVPWNWMEDRLRKPRAVSMWDGLEDFAGTAVRAYRLNVWATQPEYFEAWLEKDALSGIFEDALRPYGVTLNVGRGYDGWDSIHNAAERYKDEEYVTILYFGDFDPSGEDMARSLSDRIHELGCDNFELVKCALTLEDVEKYNLPTDFTKKTDTRRKKFIKKYGDVSVELDALPANVLRSRLISEIENKMDLQALDEIRREESYDKDEIYKALNAL